MRAFGLCPDLHCALESRRLLRHSAQWTLRNVPIVHGCMAGDLNHLIEKKARRLVWPGERLLHDTRLPDFVPILVGDWAFVKEDLSGFRTPYYACSPNANLFFLL